MNTKTFIIRIVSDIILVSAAMMFPWWIFIPLSIAAAFLIDRHYELVLIGFLADAAFGTGAGGASAHFFFLAATVIIVLASIILKPRLMFYRD